MAATSRHNHSMTFNAKVTFQIPFFPGILDIVLSSMSSGARKQRSFADRAGSNTVSPIARYLFGLISIKRSNLCVSADVHTTEELLQVAEEVGDYICVLKTHADIVDDFSERTIRGLQELSRRKHFLLFEDRKFGDIGSEFCLRGSSSKKVLLPDLTLFSLRYPTIPIYQRAHPHCPLGSPNKRPPPPWSLNNFLPPYRRSRHNSASQSIRGNNHNKRQFRAYRPYPAPTASRPQ